MIDCSGVGKAGLVPRMLVRPAHMTRQDNFKPLFERHQPQESFSVNNNKKLEYWSNLNYRLELYSGHVHVVFI